MLGAIIPGLSKLKIMCDLGCSSSGTIIIDHPLSLDPINLLLCKNILDYDPSRAARFGRFPRHGPINVAWVEIDDSFVVSYTANAWDDAAGQGNRLNLLACRMNSATLIYTAGNMQSPANALPKGKSEAEKCHLYYWCFEDEGKLATEFTHSNVPIEVPSLNPSSIMNVAAFI
ncbi:hypothetical protein K437DRAFT_136029 [Tilletiaria anomala UBC 951]|uniref:Uncharacterized protein n=1 Tax=Tilletiaria anomala (strain ATCC 24038 / CBS 436.72 / UBC 951) TaxID=1037660 RepID=A0A066VS31_TILAU|nr:uncharacterized protein K437DRAFT_136029 [Tilletiaria anomala UBC 951]KDN44537.1 hypothetical protein K437DRAFT_136029 [Tilletiaria anomala UBC 951]